MARFYIEGTRADASNLHVWDRIEKDFVKNHYERRAARNLYQLTGYEPFLWDTAGRQRAVDILLRGGLGGSAVAEVSSAFDPLLQRDTDNTFRFESEIRSGYDGEASWVLHFRKGWEIPPTKQRRLLAARVRDELLDREESRESGPLRTCEWAYARHDPAGQPGVRVGAWDARVDSRVQRSVHDSFTQFFDGDLMRSKRQKLISAAHTLGASARHLYLFTTPAGVQASLGAAHIWDLADGAFCLPQGVDCLWLDGMSTSIRRFSAEAGWTVYAI